MDKSVRREIRSLKTEKRKRSVDIEESLLPTLYEHHASPFEQSGNSSSNNVRDGRALWAIARDRVREIRAQSSSRLSNPEPSPSIIENFLFNLTSKPIYRSLRFSPSGRNLLPPESPGTFEPGKDFTHLWNMIVSSYLNVLLIAIPIGIAAGIMAAPASLVFIANFFALIPLALILGEITEDLALRFGDAIGGLLNATFGNVVEGILGIAALSRGLYPVVAASLIGSILSNLLLVLGCCFLFGGVKYKHQTFNPLANKVSSSLLFLACIAIIIPTMARRIYGPETITQSTLTTMSHAIALLLVVMYVSYLFFQLKTHASEFSGGEGDCSVHHPQIQSRRGGNRYGGCPEEQRQMAAMNGTLAASSADDASYDDDEEEEDEDQVPALSLVGALGTLSIITVLVALASEYLTGAIEEVSELWGINQAFLGLIVLPIAGNAAEHITAVFVAVKDKMDLAISVALGSSIQIALFVLPVTVLVGWGIGHELTLDFDPFAVVMMTVSVVLAFFVTSDGLSNWILGLQLVITYVLIGSVFLLEKESGGGGGGGASGSSGNSIVSGLLTNR